jgi:hypothetical protein
MSELATPMTDAQRAELRKTADVALDELTAALTQVFKAVNKVHRAVSRLGIAVDVDGIIRTGKDNPNSED